MLTGTVSSYWTRSRYEVENAWVSRFFKIIAFELVGHYFLLTSSLITYVYNEVLPPIFSPLSLIH